MDLGVIIRRFSVIGPSRGAKHRDHTMFPYLPNLPVSPAGPLGGVSWLFVLLR